MAHYDLEEQEQIDTLKTWWNMHGNLVTGIIGAVAIAMLAWQGWNWYQRSQAAQAAAIYAVLEQAVDAGDAQKTKTAAGELADHFGGTAYASLGALLAAQQSVEANDLKTARVQLSWAADHAKDEVRDIANLRLAGLLLDDKAYDEALKRLEQSHAAAFDARFLDLKGDVLAAQGKKAEARAAYKAAQEKSAAKSGVTAELLKQKIDNLGEGA